jgi:amidase
MSTTRRRFLRDSSLAALGAAAGTGCNSQPGNPGGQPSSNAADPQSPGAGGPATFELDEVTIDQLQQRMQAGQYTARRVTELYLARIAALDRQGPTLRAVLETNPDAVRIADELDTERRAKGPRGLLHGIPILVKDNVDTADRMTTTAGSLALEGLVRSRDAHLVERFRAAGAIVLAKTNLSEWANFRSTRSSSGWSARGAQCRNPYALDRNPCGSSSGTGAGIAANCGAAGIGTETDGSIVCPSSANSLVGLKPTVGLISRRGIVPIAHSQDTAGPMTRTVRDAAILLSVMAGADSGDDSTRGIENRRQAAYTKFLDPAGLRGARLGVPRKKFFGYSAAADRVVAAALDDMRRLGATIVDLPALPHADELDQPEFELLLYEFRANVDQYLTSLPSASPVKSLKDVIAFNEAHREREMPYFGQEILLMAQDKGPLTDKRYLSVRNLTRRLSRREGIDAIMNEHRLDALVTPTGTPPWVIDLVNGDHYVGGSSTPAAVAGYPALTVPAGFVLGLPVGLSFFGRAFSEPTLFKLAFAYEQATHHRKSPKFLPTAELASA